MNPTREEILSANVALHRDEAALYDRIHPELNNPEELGRLRRLVKLAVSSLPSDHGNAALDLGAGTGLITGVLVEQGFDIDAVDLSPEMLSRLRAKFADAIRSGRVSVTESDADAFLARAPNYGLIAASSVLHHLPDYGATIRSMIAKLQPGGTLIFFHEPTSSQAGPIERFFRRVDWWISLRFVMSRKDLAELRRLNLSYDMADYHATHGFDEEKVLQILKEAGCDVLRLERYATAHTWLLRRIFSWFFPPTTWALVAKKR